MIIIITAQRNACSYINSDIRNNSSVLALLVFPALLDLFLPFPHHSLLYPLSHTYPPVCIIVGDFHVGLSSVGGFNSMREQFLRSASNETYYAQSTWDNRSCGTISSKAFSIYRPANDGGYPWTGMLLGMPILATNAWCTDQVHKIHIAWHI